MAVFKKSVRHQKKLKMGIIGPSGSGKTYSSLLLARGIVGEKGRIAFVDSENRSSELYSDLTDFDTTQLSEKMTIDEVSDAVKSAIDGNYDILVIDTITPVWNTLLEIHEKYARQTGNSFTSWNKVTPLYNKFVDTIVRADIHLIFTIRAKTQYEVVVGDDKKMTPKKMGIGPVFRQGIDYEPDITFDMHFNGESNVAMVTKSRIKVLPLGHEFIPSIEIGESINAWLSGGAIEEIESETKPVEQKPKRGKTISKGDENLW